MKLLLVNRIVLEQKNNGVGTVVKTNLFEIEPALLVMFQRIISEKVARAVREDSGVMGAFVRAEQPRPNFLHTMIIFRDEVAAQKYFSSRAYKNYRKHFESSMDFLVGAQKSG